MPSIATSLVSIGITARITRSSLIKTYGDDFVATLRAKGLSSVQILLHVAKNAALPVMTIAGLQVGFLVSGSVLTETIFSWPGIGQATFQAISARDLNVIEASVVLLSLTFIVANLCVDILQGLLDPRMRRAA
jgi:ABC-type dipeptide/oligopeptide/nickel transport system permease component